ncbi:DNA phosphorothioation-associated putative methyltransferase [Romeria aff. gracilis LEGE 07310]|uniref:DNA phosphorothioation-associated putative methyltransferase n=1 Tax=Vasconcelosia minhoensis LEGE 07310 TaxID=915328 RepID=A0A8J7DDU9_9CYAN|nr:DNA phosphorothioation-associated putative methyltransferase [Romeria gracilis]MBE9079178.1 DNA phosphorothioation-associated putative methyltransferase [Romeria aff. gracilis LEGE 07310]
MNPSCSAAPLTMLSLHQLATLCRQSPIGKCLPGAFYIHHTALSQLDPQLQAYEALARSWLSNDVSITLVKFHFEKPALSYLFYPDFDSMAHPALAASVQIVLPNGRTDYRSYCNRANPPVLHRKETFVAPDYPGYEIFARLTHQQVALGLLENSRTIGTRLGWQNRLQAHNLMIVDHRLACPLEQPSSPPQAVPNIERHRAAIVRNSLSKPVRLALEAGLFSPEATFFDYGCGHGGDVSRLHRQGYASAGWDPYYQPQIPLTQADIVNLGYVLNVIEDAAERREALVRAWELSQQALIVSAQVLICDRAQNTHAYGDGIITRRNTFQKYYEQEELKAYIDQVLGVDSIPVALGIYFIFRDEAQAENFRASRFRSRAAMPRVRLSIRRFEDCRERLQPLMDFYTDRGRLPKVDELSPETLRPLQVEFGTIRRAFGVILKATDGGEWDAIADRRRQDLMVYLALSHFGRRPKFRDLSPPVQQDVKALFGSYQQACTAADLMLMSLGRMEIIEERCRQSSLGQQRPNSLWVHVSALDQLDPLLRLYEGCASRTIGRPEEAAVVKFHTSTPKITYLFFPTFDTEPHPALHTSMQIGLRDLRVRYRDYDPADNPPLLHQKEQMITPDYAGYGKFAKLSQQERNWGLLDDLSAIYDRQGWEECLEAHCAELKGHRIVWRKDTNPYQIKLLQTARRQRSIASETG